MQTSIIQLVVLTTYGNAFLKGMSLPEKFFPGNSAFEFCKAVRFVDLQVHGDHYHELPYADEPAEFFKRLKDEGYKSLRIHYAPGQNEDVSDRMTTGFVGGGSRWLLEARHDAFADYWEARWDNGEEEDGNIWDVAYGRIVKGHDSATPAPGEMTKVKLDLIETLGQIKTFAQANNLEDFAKSFDEALTVLRSETPLKNSYYADLAPEGTLPLEALQLLAGAQAAWVFGGMGSWNDLGFMGTTQHEYETLSDELYYLLLAAISEAANASAA